MKDASELRPKVCEDPFFRVTEATADEWEFNRLMYERVGSQWKWGDKLEWTDEEWRRYAQNDRLHTFVAQHNQLVAGYFELMEQEGEVEIAYFGLVPDFIGRGFGGALLTRAIEEAWNLQPKRVWLHTCTQDHPAALANYQARGMVVCRRVLSS